jgi:hypothetical protein
MKIQAQSNISIPFTGYFLISGLVNCFERYATYGLNRVIINCSPSASFTNLVLGWFFIILGIPEPIPE